MIANTPAFISRISCISGLVGGLLGVAISLNNGDELGWSLLRGSILIVAFSTASRWWLQSLAVAWLETRLESIQEKTKPAELRGANRV